MQIRSSGTAVHAMSRVPCHCPGCKEHRRRRAYRVTGNLRDGEPGNVWCIVYAAGEAPVYENDFQQRHNFVGEQVQPEPPVASVPAVVTRQENLFQE